MTDSELLRHHPAERDSHDRGAVPTGEVEHRRGVVGVVAHGVGDVGLGGLPEAPLVVGENVEGVFEGAGEDAGVSEVAAGPVEIEERRAGPGALVVDADAANVSEGHGYSPANSGSRFSRKDRTPSSRSLLWKALRRVNDSY